MYLALNYLCNVSTCASNSCNISSKNYFRQYVTPDSYLGSSSSEYSKTFVVLFQNLPN